MDFIKKNWEKVLLGAVLVGLLIAVVGLPLKIAGEKDALQRIRTSITEIPVSEIEPVDLSSVEATLERNQWPVRLDLTTSNRVFNPVTWKRSPSGQLLRVNTGKEIGVRALQVEGVSPLYLIVTLDSVLTSDSGTRYAIGVERQAATSKRGRVKRQNYAAVGDKNDNFRVLGIKGPPEAPISVDLELSDTGQRISLSKDAPFQRVDGYTADLFYPPESRTWSERRVGDRIPLERQYYNIVAITEREVVLSAQSGKKTSLKASPKGEE